MLFLPYISKNRDICKGFTQTLWEGDVCIASLLLIVFAEFCNFVQYVLCGHSRFEKNLKKNNPFPPLHRAPGSIFLLLGRG